MGCSGSSGANKPLTEREKKALDMVEGKMGCKIHPNNRCHALPLIYDMDKKTNNKLTLPRLAFYAFDTNGDQCLDKAEFGCLLEKCWKEMGKPDKYYKGKLDDYLKEADCDGDGMLTVNEYLNWAHPLTEEEKHKLEEVEKHTG